MQETITCKNCGNHFLGKYCNQCGEKVYSEKDKHLKHVFEEVFHFLTHFEGSFFTTLKTFIRYPGKLSADYCSGIRKKYFKPIPFFLMLVVLYLLFPKFKGLNMAAGTYVSSENSYTSYSVPVFKAKMKKHNASYAEIAKHYDETSPKVSKISLLLLIPLCAIVLACLFILRRKPFFDHFILSAELLSFFILTQFLFMPFLSFLVQKIAPQFEYLFYDNSLLHILMDVLFAFFTVIAFRNFYKEKYWLSILKAIIFLVVFTVGVRYIYYMVVFLLTMLFV